jgi:Na+/H+-translocating membrane pyrophosphatase
MIFRRNNLNIGIGLGMLLPLVVFLILSGLNNMVSLPLKTRTFAIISICLNIILIQFFRKNRANESIRGIVIATVVMSILWLFWFYEDIQAEWNM